MIIIATKPKKEDFTYMAILTQDLLFKQAVIRCSQKNGVTEAAKRYKTTRQWIYYWLRRYDGTLASLKERSRKPHHHPKEHTEQELTLIANIWDTTQIDQSVYPKTQWKSRKESQKRSREILRQTQLLQLRRLQQTITKIQQRVQQFPYATSKLAIT